MAGCRILIVDDDKDARDSLRALLEMSGHEVQEAGDGDTALQIAASANPDVVFLDIGLPGLDGFTVAERLRGMARAGHPFIVALTGYGQDKYLDRARRGGFDAYVLKPADIDELLRLIDRVSCEDVATPGSGTREGE